MTTGIKLMITISSIMDDTVKTWLLVGDFDVREGEGFKMGGKKASQRERENRRKKWKRERGKGNES